MRRRLLSEGKINSSYVDKIFKLIENDLGYHPFNGVSINIGDLDNKIEKRQGINVTLKKGGSLGIKFINTIMDTYGTTEEESKILWDKVRIYLKKLKFIEHASFILYEDWVKWEKNPYIIQDLDEPYEEIKYKINKLGDFIKFMHYTGIGKKEYDPHSEETINFLELLDESDFEYIQSEVFSRIDEKSDNYSSNDDYSAINESGRFNYETNEYDYISDDIFGRKTYEKFFKYLDFSRESIFQSLKALDLNEENVSFVEANLIYKYLTEYENRTPLYIDIVFDSESLSELFYDDREYDIRGMVKNYLDGDYDYEYDINCFEIDGWLIDKIDQDNMKILKEKYLENLEGESSEEDFIEFIESEYGTEIGCAAGDAQHSADIDSLHNDIISGIVDYLSNFNGKLESDGVGGLHYKGSVEIGELANSPHFEDVLSEWLDEGYPSNFFDLYYDIKERELSGYSSEYNYFFSEDLIRFNTDRHFRYGGAGNIDWGYFNEILSDRLSSF
jgi:hypothetical protein